MYAIGDIHGRLDPLVQLVEAVRRDAAGVRAERRVMVFLGDYLDRGLESRQVIDFLLASPAPDFETVYLKGNHEALALAFLDDPVAGRQWLAAGGQATLVSYGVAAPPTPRSADFLHSLRRGFAAALPGTHRAFLDRLVTQHVEGDYAFAHAGILPGTPLSAQPEAALLWSGAEFTSDTRDHGKVIVHGHSVVPEPVVRDNRIGIDTGAYATGRLTCHV